MLNVRFIVAVLLVFAALGISVAGAVMTKNIAIRLYDLTNRVVCSGDENQRLANADVLITQWQDKKQLLSLFVDSSKYEQIDSLIVQVYSYVELKDSEAVNVSCAQLLQQLQFIISQEEISIYNLL